jgi:hypothetical protein
MGNKQSSSQKGGKSAVQKDLRPLRKQLGGYFQQQLSDPSFANVPKGMENLYAGLVGNPSSGQMGVLQQLMQGQGLQKGYEQAYNALLPGTQSAIASGSRDITQNLGTQGLRFSTDLQNSIGQFANQQYQGLQQNALGAGLQNMQGMLGAANTAAGLTEGQLGRQLPLLMQYATGFAPVASGGGGSGTSSFLKSIW